MGDCSVNYKPAFIRRFLIFIFKLSKVNYELKECKGAEKIKLDLIYYTLLAIGLVVLVLAIVAVLVLIARCGRLTRTKILQRDNQMLVKSMLEKYNRRSSDNVLGPEVVKPSTNAVTTVVTKDVSLKRRLEMMEFQRRLLIHQMLKRQELEESSVEKLGNVLRNGLNFLFGEPRRGLDFGDPQVMFYPYWPKATDYNLLTAYGAVREHMTQDANLFSQNRRSKVTSAEEKSYQMMPRYTTGINNDLTQQLLNTDA